MMENPDPPPKSPPHDTSAEEEFPDNVCPVCGAKLISEKCKVVCRSERCRYRIIFNCAEF
jgi:hypothetical protein